MISPLQLPVNYNTSATSRIARDSIVRLSEHRKWRKFRMRITAVKSLKPLILLLAAGLLPAAAQQAAPPAAPPGPQFLLTMPAFGDGSDVPVKYTCSVTPAAVSPVLQWKNVPQGAASFTLIFHDPDAHPAKA